MGAPKVSQDDKASGKGDDGNKPPGLRKAVTASSVSHLRIPFQLIK